jgi:hypothetical protein
MTRIATLCVLGGALAALALSANSASAIKFTFHNTPTVHVQTTTPKTNPNGGGTNKAAVDYRGTGGKGAIGSQGGGSGGGK